MRCDSALTLVISAGLCCAQITPLRNTMPPTRSAEIGFLRVNLMDLCWGHEGPDYFPTRRAPQRGAQEIADVAISGQAAIAVIRFEVIDEAGRPLSAAPAIRTSSGADDGSYYLRVTVPEQPFRFRITGNTLGGRSFTRIHPKLFRPGSDAPPAPLVPDGLTPGQAAQLRKLLDSTRAELGAQLDAAPPDGSVRIARTEVLEPGYEPLLSAEGRQLGLRLHLAVRFSADGNYAVAPSVAPLYASFAWRGLISMRAIDARVDPAPEVPAGAPLADVIRYGAAARYRAGAVYRFTFDLAPSYVVRNASGTRYCLYLEQFRGSPSLSLWNAILADATPVKYSVSFFALGFAAETAPLPPQRTWYESFLREGAPDCGPTPNVNF